MLLTSDQKRFAFQLLIEGQKSRVVQYLRHTHGLSPLEAVKYMEKLEEETRSPTFPQEFKAMKVKSRLTGSKIPRLIGITFMSVGAIMLASVAYIVFEHNKFLQRAISVTAVLVSHDTYLNDEDEDRSTSMYTPTYEYTFNGKKFSTKSGFSSSSSDLNIGKKIEILVDPDDPQNVVINSFWERWFVAVALGGLGSLFAALGYMATRVSVARSASLW